MSTSTTATESTPLISPPLSSQTGVSGNTTSAPPTKAARTVTFSPYTTISSPENATTTSSRRPPVSDLSFASSHGKQPMLSALNSKIRRRNSYGSPLTAPAGFQSQGKIGPQRTTKTAQKLKLLPNPDIGEDGPDEESGRDVYSQFTRIKDPTARSHAARLGKADRDRLPRVTAYCTANAYKTEGLMRFLKGRGKMRGAVPKLFDECIYTPYHYEDTKTEDDSPPQGQQPIGGRRYSDSAVEVEDNKQQRREELINLHSDGAETAMNGENSAVDDSAIEVQQGDEQQHREDSLDFDTQVHTPEIFLFAYGAVVIWGMTKQQEARFLREISKFEMEKLSEDDVQTEDFNFYYTRDYQARIYNDFISLRDKKNYMTKLAISHALAQSVKVSLFEDLVDNTIEATKDLPEQIAQTGKVNLTSRQINMQIGELFILRINIHLQGSVLDSPELMWAEPQLEPVYLAVRSYLEMDQRVGLLTERLDVIGDLLAVLKDQLTHTHGEYLEWIVIVLIAAEIIVAVVNIVVDLYAGV
ncbi:MAG: hypothetical protein M1819_001142 [Sarea resinae]|nr:MAG: hypothetical protein M1819_001142 [Sarea resinae]